jgi:hypothetical protein
MPTPVISPNQPKPNALPSTPQAQPQPQQLATQKPVITNVQPIPCVSRGSIISIQGNSFGASAGTNRVALNAGTAVVLPVNSWSDVMIVAKIIDDPRLTDGGVYSVGIQNAMGAWISNTDKQIKLCPGTAKPVTPGAKDSTTAPAASSTPSDTRPPATEATFVPVSVRTTALTYTGRGATSLEPSFTPIRLSTGTLTYTGRGATSLEPPFTPIRLRTGTLSYTAPAR